MALVASGKVAIPANKMHESLSAEAVGQDCRTKINVNLGVSPEHNNHEEELQKVQNAIDMKLKPSWTCPTSARPATSAVN